MVGLRRCRVRPTEREKFGRPGSVKHAFRRTTSSSLSDHRGVTRRPFICETPGQLGTGQSRAGGRRRGGHMQGTGSDGLWGPPVTSELSHARAISITRLPDRRRRAGRIPKPAGLLIGRGWELDAIRYALLYDDVRLLTLWGPAGIGKTRLALATATDPELARAFQDVVFVDLPPLTEANHVMPAIAEAFGLGDGPHPLLLDQLESVLNCRRVLLILDNFEHVLEFAPQLARLLANCPTVTILATSRAALQLRSERAFPVAPLAVPRSGSPTDAATAATYPAVALFAERARAAS